MAKDLTIVLENRPGTLAKASEALAKAGINIEGAAGFPCGGEGIFHVLTRDVTATRKAAESAGFKVKDERDVVVIDGVPDRPGEAAKIFRKIADAEVNVDLFYVATNTRIVIGASNIAKVRETLRETTAGATRK
jgi:hypothetical protein